MASVDAPVALDSRVRLGLALGARAKESVRLQTKRLGAHGERAYSSEYEENRRLRVLFGTLFVARWLVTGVGADEDEHAWMMRGGQMAVAEGVPTARTVRGYICWRDAVIEILRDSAAELETPAAALEEAITVTRASCDASLLRMAGDQDRHREETTSQIAASEARLRGLYDSMACGVLVVDRGGRVTSFNQAAASIIGGGAPHRLSTANLLQPRMPVRDANGVELQHLLAAVIEDRRPLRGQVLQVPTESRGTIWVQADFVPVLDAEGAIDQVVVTFIDVTDIKEAERERADNAAKSRFLAIMSHELRTPLNSVLGFAQLLRMRVGDRLDERELRYLDNIETSGRSLLGVINDILDLTSASDGSLAVRTAEIDVRPVLEAVRDDMQTAASAKGLRIEVSVAERVRARADRNRLRQVLLHLVSNALKFTGAGCVTLAAQAEDGQVEVTVTDTGIGIAAENLERIFEDFAQIDGGLNRSQDGAGVGLSLARSLVELMHGNLKIESEVGRGTTVRVRLPSA